MYNNFYLTLIIQFLIIYNINSQHFEIDITNDTLVTSCINNILKKIYEPETIILMIDTFTRTSLPIVYYNTSKRSFKKISLDPPEIYVITAKEESVTEIFKFVQKIDMFNHKAKVLLRLTTGVNYERVFANLAKRFIYKVVLIDVNDNLVSYDPFNHEEAEPSFIEPKILGSCANIPQNTLFSYGSPLWWRNTTVKTLYSNHYPYLYHEGGELVGETYQLFRLIEEKLQFHPDFEEQQAVLNGTTYIDVLGSSSTYSVF
ncbi:hypothetical protein Zmor_023156 [Zophobas morio]|uniref:Uncharacterized protein n=1 Tax=Zophobas morio TaxID=2755281 RepID=A0AA38HZ87_9CUCU|nr:hypothetical protein Zmor_023156 [Zophobas morio]